MWVMGEWAVDQWIVGVTSFQKIYGLYGLKHHMGDVTMRHGWTNNKGRKCNSASDLYIPEFRNEMP